MRSTGIGPANIRAADHPAVTAPPGGQLVQAMPAVVLRGAAAEIDSRKRREPKADGDLVEPVNFGRRQAVVASRGAFRFRGVVLSAFAAEPARAS